MRGPFKLAIFLIGHVGGFVFQSNENCVVNLDMRIGAHIPLILRNGRDIAYPVADGRFIQFVSGEKLTLFCHGTEVSKNGLSLESMGLGSEFPVSLDLTCVDKEFQHNGDKIGIDKLYGATCTRVLEPFITKEEKSDCSNGMGADGRTDDLDLVSLVKVGWLFGDGEFQEQYRACIDEKVFGTLWTEHKINGQSIYFSDTSNVRPDFRVDNRGYNRFFTFAPAYKVDDAYSKTSQVKVVSSLLGTNNQLPNGDAIIDDSASGTNFFAKGHLSPDATFIEATEQDASYFYFNAAPQFQSFNNGNWRSLETASRKYAAISGNVQVWTGTFDILKYPDLNGNDVPIYLYITDGNRFIPSPKYFWKVLLNTSTKKAIAFVGLNDPHSVDVAPENTFCHSVCNVVSGVNWDTEDETKGHMVCCTVQELKELIPFAPHLPDSVLETDLSH